MTDYDPNLDWTPPKRVLGDDILVDDPELGGEVEFWKSLLYRTAKARHARIHRVRADSALTDERQPPRLAADRRAAKIDEVNAKIDALNKRLDVFEARKAIEAQRDAAEARAEKALLDAERIFTTPEPGEDDDSFAGGGFGKSPAPVHGKKSEV
jgi:hypothetical protein